MLTKEQAISLYGTAYQLSKALGLTPAAVYQWKPGKYIPWKQYLRLKYEINPAGVAELEAGNENT